MSRSGDDRRDRGPGLTVTVFRDGQLGTATYRIPLRAYRAFLIGAIVLGVLLVLGIGFYGPIVRQALRVPGLSREVEQLRGERHRIGVLAAALDSVERNYDQLRRMVGAEVVPDPVVAGASLAVAAAIVVVPAAARLRYESGPSLPRHWPLDERGYLTRGQVTDSSDESHRGVDIAVPVGALVRAAGGGTVVQAGQDAEYGRFVLLQHPNGYQSMYGHLSRVVARPGSQIQAGEVVGRSGNTGRSSAPHLHLELRHNGTSIDPMTLIRENR